MVATKNQGNNKLTYTIELGCGRKIEMEGHWDSRVREVWMMVMGIVLELCAWKIVKE